MDFTITNNSLEFRLRLMNVETDEEDYSDLISPQIYMVNKLISLKADYKKEYNSYYSFNSSLKNLTLLKEIVCNKEFFNLVEKYIKDYYNIELKIEENFNELNISTRDNLSSFIYLKLNISKLPFKIEQKKIEEIIIKKVFKEEFIIDILKTSLELEKNEKIKINNTLKITNKNKDKEIFPDDIMIPKERGLNYTIKYNKDKLILNGYIIVKTEDIKYG